jgi:hypothetical protein
LPLDPRFTGSNQAEDGGFLRAIKVSNATSFRGKVKPAVSCHTILWHVKKRYKYERNTSQAKFIGHFFVKFLLLHY